MSHDNKISLISLLEGLTIALPPNQEIPTNATIPMRWFAVSIWGRQPKDANKEFESFVEIGFIKSAPAKFRLPTPMHRVVAQIQGFPIQFGDMRLKTYLREAGVGEFQQIGEDFPLTLQRASSTTH